MKTKKKTLREALASGLPLWMLAGTTRTIRRSRPKVYRNEPCRCGSAKKYKRCCWAKDQGVPTRSNPMNPAAIAQNILHFLFSFARR